MMGNRTVLFQSSMQLIDDLSAGQQNPQARDQVLEALLHWQSEHVPVYRAYLKQQSGTHKQFPALPTDLYRFARVASYPESEDRRVFLSSGTTQQARSQHVFRDLSLYRKAAYQAARYALFPDVDRMRLLSLVPGEQEAPSSSLAFMVARFMEDFGDSTSSYAWRKQALELDVTEQALHSAVNDNAPIALLGTSFAFVHLLDATSNKSWHLPKASRLMLTGGYKGRSREVDPDLLRQQLSERLGLPEACIIAEYGMTELSSQMYENTLRQSLLGEASTPRRYWIPGWLKVSAIDPETLHSLPRGQPGMLRFDDAANVDSCCAVQSADIGVLDEYGLSLLGRDANAVPRGCSLDAENSQPLIIP